MLSQGEVFEPGKFIEVDGVEILYNGKSFLVTNNRDDMVRVSCSVVGVKKDGTIVAVGNNDYGQLGLDDTASRNVFTQIHINTKNINKFFFGFFKIIIFFHI